MDEDAARQSVSRDRGGWRRGRLGLLVDVVETLVLAAVAFFVIQAFVAQPFQVQQHSMEQTFNEGDYLLVDRLSPRWSPYQRGQVVVFAPPAGWTTQTEPYIKRVIGVAGDTVEIRGGLVHVNGVALDEPYLFRDAAGKAEPTQAHGKASWVVPTGQLFVMGDHRQASSDSRAFGPIAVDTVIGRGLVRYWPLPAFGLIQGATYGDIPAP